MHIAASREFCKVSKAVVDHLDSKASSSANYGRVQLFVRALT